MMRQEKSPISVMIVDDESLYIDEIKLLYSFQDHGFDLVCTASNGKDALEKFHQYAPQVVITDIEMPILNGIDLCREIRKSNSRTRLLFLTAYDEFNYIKSALHVSAFDYLLKYELSEQLLTEKMQDIREQIEAEHLAQSELLLSAIYSLFQSPENQVSGSSFLSDLLSRSYLYIVAELNQPLPLVPLSSVPLAALNDYRTLLSKGAEKYCFVIRDSQLLFLVSPRHFSSESSLANLVSAKLGDLQERLGQDARLFTFFTAAQPLCLPDFHRLYFDRLPLFFMKYFYPAGAPISLLDPPPAPLCPKIDLASFYQALHEADQSQAEQAIQAIFQALGQSKNYELLLSTMQKLYYHLKDAGADALCPVAEPSDCRTFADLENWLFQAARGCIEEKRRIPLDKLSPPVRKAIVYIHQHLSIQDLTLETVAEQVFLSVGQLNKLLKKEAGITMYQYIKSSRINLAKRLLRSTNCPVYEIAEQCGYRSSQHFSQLFHEATGKSPSAFRREYEQKI